MEEGSTVLQMRAQGIGIGENYLGRTPCSEGGGEKMRRRGYREQSGWVEKTKAMLKCVLVKIEVYVQRHILILCLFAGLLSLFPYQ